MLRWMDCRVLCVLVLVGGLAACGDDSGSPRGEGPDPDVVGDSGGEVLDEDAQDVEEDTHIEANDASDADSGGHLEDGAENDIHVDADDADEDVEVDGGADVDAPQGARLVPSPDLVRLAQPGERVVLEWVLVDGRGEAADVSPADLVVRAGTSGVFDWDEGAVYAVAPGRDTLVAFVGDLSAEVTVVVAPDAVALTGNAGGVHALWPGRGLAEAVEGWTTGMNPSSLVVDDHGGYALFSGDPWGGTQGSSLIVFDPFTLAPRSTWTDIAAAGAQALAVVDDTQAFVIGPDDGVLPFNPSTGEAGDWFALPEGESVPSLSGGAAALAWGPYLAIVNSGILPGFAGYVASALYFWDIEEEAFFDGWPTDAGAAQAQPYLLMPASCRNAGYVAFFELSLVVGCKGDYGAYPASLHVLDLRELAWRDSYVVEGGYAVSFALEPRTGIIALGSALALGVALVDLREGVVLRDFADPITLAPMTSAAWDTTGVSLGPDGTFLVAAFNADEVFALDPRAVLDSPLATLLDLNPGATGLGTQNVTWLPSGREVLYLSPDIARILPSGPVGAGFQDPANAFGPPTGGGKTVPNASSTELLLVPSGEHVVIALDGVRLVDGAGPDFVLYENVFFAGNDFFNRAVDPAVVEVSVDGEAWFAFPYELREDYEAGPFSADPRRFVGFLFGIEPTFAHAENNRISSRSPAAGGDRFDLATLGLSEARYVRIRALPGTHYRPALNAMGLLNWERE